MPKQKKSKSNYIRHQFKHGPLARKWRKFGFRHTTSAFIVVVLFIVAFDSAIVQTSLDEIHKIGYAGLIIGGAMFTSLFTTAPGVAILLSFTDIYSPLTIALIGATGSVIGDLIILRVFEEKIGYELTPLIKKFHLRGFFRRIKRKKERERTVLLGMIAIASPLPDEIGIGLLGIARLPLISLLTITYLLNAAGILVLIYGVNFF